jgi:hypothetical protein
MLERSTIFEGLGGRQIWELKEVGQFLEFREVRKFGMSKGLEGLAGGRIGMILSHVIYVFLQLHVNCVSYYSGVVLHVVQIHINISIQGVPGGMCLTS